MRDSSFCTNVWWLILYRCDGSFCIDVMAYFVDIVAHWRCVGSFCRCGGSFCIDVMAYFVDIVAHLRCGGSLETCWLYKCVVAHFVDVVTQRRCGSSLEMWPLERLQGSLCNTGG